MYCQIMELVGEYIRTHDGNNPLSVFVGFLEWREIMEETRGTTDLQLIRGIGWTYHGLPIQRVERQHYLGLISREDMTA